MVRPTARSLSMSCPGTDWCRRYRHNETRALNVGFQKANLIAPARAAGCRQAVRGHEETFGPRTSWTFSRPLHAGFRRTFGHTRLPPLELVIGAALIN
ncbi:hypothetical protein PSAB6_340109 [Paraburkholderia sabiae]|nr:hypothetical protein PSAB6_340109 [Paraburkholderia sabiae]